MDLFLCGRSFAWLFSIKSWSNAFNQAGGLLGTWEMIAKRQNTRASFHRVCETFTIFCWNPLRETSGLGRLRTYFERVDVDVPNKSNSATVPVVLLAPREPAQFMISFLLHNSSVPIGSKVFSLRSIWVTRPKSVCLRRKLPSASSLEILH